MSRLAARRAALQLLYEQMMGGSGGDETLLGLIGFHEDEQADLQFIEALLQGVEAHGAALDAEISTRSPSRELSRIPLVTRAILRMALYELMYLKDVPAPAVINEAVELSNRFAEDSDSRFINGVLGSFVRSQQQA